jgi:hypothetical protein
VEGRALSFPPPEGGGFRSTRRGAPPGEVHRPARRTAGKGDHGCAPGRRRRECLAGATARTGAVSSGKRDRGPSMDNSSEGPAEDRPTRRRRRPIVLTVLLTLIACAAAAVGVVSWTSERVSSDLTDQEMTCCWEDGATPAWMSAQIGIRIPETASDHRAGYKVGQRYDTGLLSFVLRSDEAAAYTGRLIREGTRMSGNLHPEEQGYRPAAAFQHLGLAGAGNLRAGAAEDQHVPRRPRDAGREVPSALHRPLHPRVHARNHPDLHPLDDRTVGDTSPLDCGQASPVTADHGWDDRAMADVWTWRAASSRSPRLCRAAMTSLAC